MRSSAKQQPQNARIAGPDIKLNLRVVRIRDRSYRLLTLRPGAHAAFSTNHFHDTWHILSDGHGARVLARLLWFLAYQRAPGTLVALYGEHLRPTPFEAEPSTPVLLVPSHLTPLDRAAFRLLKERLPRLGRSQGTVRCRTFGMDAGLTDEYPGTDEAYAPLWRDEYQHLWQAEQMRWCGGWICYAAPPLVLRYTAQKIHRLDASRQGEDYQYLAEHGWQFPPDGEMQIFRDYRERLSRAAQARRELAAEGALPDDPATQRERIWERGFAIERRLQSRAAHRR
jgi:hypothetical protein